MAIARSAPTRCSNMSAACWRGRSSMGQGNEFRRSSRELPWELRRRGLKDSLRHDQRVKEAIRKNLRELIAEEAIITSDGTKRVKIPLRYLDQYRFKYGQPPQGVGQGEGQPGQAAVYMLMDVSGSMTTSKKYIAKSFFFWMVRFLQLKYQKVDMVFIAHDTEAQVVPEQDFFAISQGGGTRCSSAYQLALTYLQQHHPGHRWNTYLFHFSDSDNLPDDIAVCQGLVDTLLKHCSMVGYGEIRYRDDASFYGWIGQTSSAPSSLQYALQGLTHPRLLSVTITHKEELFQVLQTFLQPRETAHV